MSQSTASLLREDPEVVFARALDVELEKVSSFYAVKEQELADEANELLGDIEDYEKEGIELGRAGPSASTSDLGASGGGGAASAAWRSLRDRRGSTGGASVSADDSDEDDETTGLTGGAGSSVVRRGTHGGMRLSALHRASTVTDMTASTELTTARSAASATGGGGGGRGRRLSVIFFDDKPTAEDVRLGSALMLRKRIVALYVQLCELRSFAQLNYTGFRKILKKFDKILDRNMRPRYMEQHVDPAYPFRQEEKERLDGRIGDMERAYAAVATGGDIERARRDLRSHLREHVVWERNTVWRDLIGLERRAEAARLGRSLTLGGGLGGDVTDPSMVRLQGDEEVLLPGVVPRRQLRTPFGRINVPAWLVGTPMLVMLGILAAFAILLVAPILEAPEQQNCLAMLVLVSMLWATEAIPLFVTALLVPFLTVVLAVVRSEMGSPHRLSSKEAAQYIFAAMWTPVIMLLLGGFTLAAALSKCKIDKRIATFVLSKAGTRPRTVLMANMLVAAFASMLVSNVAAPVLCFGIIEPMLRNLPSGSNMSRAVIMGIALASNIGGMLSPIASPQNVVAIQIMRPEPTWGQWFFVSIPVGLVSIVLIWILLLATFRPGRGTTIVPIRPVKEEFTGVQWFVSIVTIATIVLWCASHRLEGIFGDMGVVAVLPIVLFFGLGVLSKEDFNNFPWTIIILAAGGLSLGKAVRSSGLLQTLADNISSHAHGMSLYAVLVVFSSIILIVSTFISHTVAALIFLPLVASVGDDMTERRPNLLVMAGVLMCSAAMGLPTSGFPNMSRFLFLSSRLSYMSTFANSRTAAIMKEDAAGQRYLRVKHFISRGVPSSLITLFVVLTLGYGLMIIAHLD